ncbi:MAG: DUF11 domain-containing protein, partial [Pedobacter sp.]
YYRDGIIYDTYNPKINENRDREPIYSILAIENNTIVKLNGVALTTLSAGESYLFKANMGSLVQTSAPAVMNTNASLDAPTVSLACYDGTSNPVPPVTSLGNEYIVVRGSGNNKSEQTTVIASEPNTVVTVYNYDNLGGLQSTNSYTLAAAGSFVTFANGIAGATGTNAQNGIIYSSSRIVATKNVVAYSGTSQACEVDVATLAPIAACSGSKIAETVKFRKFTSSTDLPYFAYIILQNGTDVVRLTTDNGYTNKDIETIAGVGVRRQLGSSGKYIIDFTNLNIGNPNILTLTSDSRLTVNMVQQGGGFSMSNFLSPLPEKALIPTSSSGDCASALLSADPSSVAPFQWYYNGTAIAGATNNTYVAPLSGTYTITTGLTCGNSAQSLPITLALCNVDRSITKTIDNPAPAVNSIVKFTLKASNFGAGNAIGVSVTDILPSGYTFVSSIAAPGTSYNNVNGLWSIGEIASGGELTLVINAKVNATGVYKNTTSITGTQLDGNVGNDNASVEPVPAAYLVLTSGAGTDTQEICIGSPITTITYSIGGSATGAVVSNLPDGLTQSFNVNTKVLTISGTPSAVTNGSQTLTVTTTGASNNVNLIGSIKVNGIVTQPVFALGATSTRCQGAEVKTYLATSTNTTGITYAITSPTNGNAGVINPSTGEMTWAADFSGNVVITATAEGCSPKTETHTITTASSGIITPTSTAVCAGSNSVTLTLSGYTGTISRWESSTDNQATWTAIDANTSAVRTFNNLNTTTTFRVVLNNGSGACGQIYSAVANIVVNPKPIVTDKSANICSGDRFTIVPSGVPGGTVYSWNVPTMTSGVTGGTAQSNQTSISQILSYGGAANTSGIATYTVTPSFGGCAGTPFTVIITVFRTAPTATISYIGSPFCRNGSTTPIITGTTGGIFSSTIGLDIDANTGTVDLGNSTVGTYTITYTFTNGNCSRTTTASITINAAPTASISYNASPVCIPNSTQLYSVNQTGGAAGAVYSISPTNGNVLVNSANGQLTVPANAVAGVYTITYTWTSNNCVNLKATTNFTITGVPTVTKASDPAAICSGSTATITTANITGTGTTYRVYDVLNGGSSLGTLPFTTPILTANKSYYIEAVSGCSSISRAKIDITVNANPTVAVIGNQGPVCRTYTRTLTNATPNGVWSSSNTAVATVNPSTGTVTGISQGPVIIAYSVTVNGCTASRTYALTVNDIPAITPITGNTQVCSGSTITLANATIGGTWSIDSPSIATINSSTGVVSGISSGTAIITYTTAANVNGCTNSTTYTITVNAAPTLVQSGGASSQTVCQGSPITTIVYTWGGGAT